MKNSLEICVLVFVILFCSCKTQKEHNQSSVEVFETKTVKVIGSFYNFKTNEPKPYFAATLESSIKNDLNKNDGAVGDADGTISTIFHIQGKGDIIKISKIGLRTLLIPFSSFATAETLILKKIPLFNRPEPLSFILTTPKNKVKKETEKALKEYFNSDEHQNIKNQINQYNEVNEKGQKLKFDCIDENCLTMKLIISN